MALRLPGHGRPRPEEFSGTKDDYASWLAQSIGQLPTPIDLVGHGWGGLLVLRLVTALVAPVRSWVVDSASWFHGGWVGSELDRTWQTPDAGERWMAALRSAPPATPEGLAGRLSLLGMPSGQAAAIAALVDEETNACVLDLARSAVPNVRRTWSVRADRAGITPGLVIVPGADPFDREGLARQVAFDLGAALHRLDGLGHYWMAESPEVAADVLCRFWSLSEDVTGRLEGVEADAELAERPARAIPHGQRDAPVPLGPRDPGEELSEPDLEDEPGEMGTDAVVRAHTE